MITDVYILTLLGGVSILALAAFLGAGGLFEKGPVDRS